MNWKRVRNVDFNVVQIIQIKKKYNKVLRKRKFKNKYILKWMLSVECTV